MLTAASPILSSNLYELNDNDHKENIAQGRYWNIIKHFSDFQSDEECYQNLDDTYKTLNDDDKFIFAASAFNIFLQNNFTGPLFPCEFLESTLSDNKEIIKKYETPINSIYHLTKCMKFFETAKNHFLIHHNGEIILTNSLFHLRCIFINQALYDEVCPNLYSQLDKIINSIETSNEFNQLGTESKSKILIEIGFIYLYYSQFTKSRHYLETARKLIGFNFKLVGAFGKRTKFITRNLAQLRVETITEENICDETPLENEPEHIDLNDETLLEKVSFADGSQSSITNMTAPFLLHTACQKLKDNYLDEMLREEVLTFLDAIIEGKTFSYCITAHAYFLRSRLEKASVKKLCRSMQQLEEVVQGFDLKKSVARTGGIFVSGLPPMWIQEKLLAELYTKCGSNKSALDIYERLQLFEDQILALQSIGRYEAAEKLTRKLLEEKESPKLYCILGDVTQDIVYYEKAWELSGHMYSRAMKSLGYHYFNVKEMPKALECMLASLKCNHLQGTMWFTAGCTALAIPDYPTAIRCFRESVLQDDENGMTWSNYGAAYQRNGDVFKAFNCYKEAVRCSYNNWRVWENYISVAAQVHHFSEVIRAYRRIVDLGQKYTDKLILNCLVAAVRDDIPDVNGHGGSQYFDKVIELFKFVSTKVTTDFQLWRSYGAMYLDIKGQEDVCKGINYLIKAYHSASLKIEKSIEEFLKCVECSNVLYKYIIAESKESPTYAQHLQSLKSILQILVTKGNKLIGTLDDSEAKESCVEYVTDANKHLDEVEELQLYV